MSFIMLIYKILPVFVLKTNYIFRWTGEINMAIKVFVDSGSSIKQNEKEKYNVEILPLKILLNNKEYSDGVDLSMDIFYNE